MEKIKTKTLKNNINNNNKLINKYYMELIVKKIKKIEKLIELDTVYDINVQDVHHYILSNGLVTHNSMDKYKIDPMSGGEGLRYSASIICYLSIAKLASGEEDDLDLGRSGNIVTAKMVKNRMAKPKKVKFEISFVSGSNPYTGLDYWCTAENADQIGICKGKMGEDGKFIAGGNRWWVDHLKTHVKGSDLHTAKVFTEEILNKMEPIINDYFRFKSVTEMEEINKRLEEAGGDISDQDLYSEEDLTADSLFGGDED